MAQPANLLIGERVAALEAAVAKLQQQPTYFGATLPNSEPPITTLHRIDLNLDSLLRRACQRLKPYILDDPKQTKEQEQCEAHLGESWKDQRTSK
ncbi:MAG: hypothetical protein C4288_10605 [Leptolyngbya sp. ERB_1_1]